MEKNNYDVIKEIEEIDSKLINLWSEKDILQTKKAELIANNPKEVIEKDFGTLTKIEYLFGRLLGKYSSSEELEGAIDGILYDVETARKNIKENVPVNAVEEKSNVNPFVLLSCSSDVMGDIEGISEFKAISELKKEFESIPFKYYKSDCSETFKEVKEKYPSIAHLSEVYDLYVPEVLDKLSSEITFLEDLNSAPLESLTEETYFSISDFLKELKSIKAVEEESVEVN